MKTGKLIKKSNKPSTKENKIPDKLFTSFCHLLNLLLTIPNYNVFELNYLGTILIVIFINLMNKKKKNVLKFTCINLTFQFFLKC